MRTGSRGRNLAAALALMMSAWVVAGCGGGEAGSPGGGTTSGADRAAAAESAAQDGGAGGEMEMEMEPERPIRITRDQAERMGLRWAVAENRPLERSTRTSALVEYRESGDRWISPRISGWVERLHVDFRGQILRAGDPVLEIYSPELVSAQEEVLLARRLRDEVRQPGAREEEMLDAALRRLRQWEISEDQIRRLLETGEVRRTLTLHARAPGVVTERRVAEGQGVRAGENLVRLGAIDTVWVDAGVFEGDLPFVREGQSARLRVQGLPGREFGGTVSDLLPEVRHETRAVTARVRVPNPLGELRPGMFATVELESRTEPVLSVPRAAVLHTGRREVVFVDEGGGRMRPTEVQTGRTGDERVELLSGLEPGTRVVASTLYLLDSEANIMEAMMAMMAEMGQLEMEDMEMDMDMDDMDMDDMDMPMDDVDDMDMEDH